MVEWLQVPKIHLKEESEWKKLSCALLCSPEERRAAVAGWYNDTSLVAMITWIITHYNTSHCKFIPRWISIGMHMRTLASDGSVNVNSVNFVISLVLWDSASDSIQVFPGWWNDRSGRSSSRICWAGLIPLVLLCSKKISALSVAFGEFCDPFFKMHSAILLTQCVIWRSHSFFVWETSDHWWYLCFIDIDPWSKVHLVFEHFICCYHCWYFCALLISP